MRTRWIVRLTVGALVPVPIAAVVVAVGFGAAETSRSAAADVLTQFLLYFGGLYVGFYMAGVQRLVYNAMMEVVGSRLPVVSRNVVPFMCFSALALSVCVYAPLYHRMAIGFFDDGMIFSLAGFTGVVMGLVLWRFGGKTQIDLSSDETLLCVAL